MHDRDLRESLQAIGALLPVLVYAGETIDGRKRAAICEELGIPIETRTLHTLREACSALFPHHPERALELVRAAGVQQNVRELAQLCGATPAAVASQIKAHTPKPARARARRRLTDTPMRQLKTQPMVKVLVLMEPELKAYAQEAAERRGHGNVNKLIRDAIWKTVALELPQMPLQPPRRVAPPTQKRKAG